LRSPDLGISNGMTASTAAEKLADGLARLALSTNVPSSQLAILGATLPRVINGAAPSTPTTLGVSDPIAGVAGENDAGLPTEGVVGEGLLAPLHLRQRRLAVLADRGR